MSNRVRIPNVGPFIEGTVTGQVLTWNQTTKDASFETPAAPSSITPLSARWFVDLASVSAAPDGSVANPFPTIAAALTAADAANLTRLELELCPGSYGATTIDFTAGGGLLETLVLFVAANAPLWTPVVWGLATVSIASIAWTPSAVALSTLVLQGVDMSGDVVITPATGVATLITDRCRLFGSVQGDTNSTWVARDTMSANAHAVGAAQLFNYYVDPASTAYIATSSGGIRAYNSTFRFGGVVGPTLFVGCTLGEFLGTLEGGAVEHRWFSSSWPGGNPTMAVPGVVQMDNSTFYFFRNSSVIGGRVDLMQGVARAQIFVNVPALAAGELGYVNVSTVGTFLEGIAGGDIVGFNPLADVEVAGAGNGGPIYVWVSAADTIRVAFLGATTAHVVIFNFWKNGPAFP